MKFSGIPAWSDKPVSKLGRVLASILLFLFASGLVGLVLLAVDGELQTANISPASVFGAIVVLPFLYSMAIKGKYPRHWRSWK